MTSKRGITRDNHYVPQFYLKNWSRNGSDVRCFNGVLRHKGQRAWNNSHIKSSCCQRDFYTDIIDGSDDDKVEHYYQSIENSASPIFDKIKNGESLQTADMQELIEYAIAQMTRTPAFFNYVNEIMPTIFERAAQRVGRELESGYDPDFAPKSPDLANQLLPISGSLNGQELTIESCCSRHMFLSSALSFSKGDIANLLRRSSWEILESDLPFLTSDNPVVLLRKNLINHEWRVGLMGSNQDRIEYVYLPLSPKQVLIARPFAPSAAHEKLALTPQLFRLLQQGTVRNATRYVFGIREDPAVAQWRPPAIDQELFETLEDERRLRNSSNLEIERDFFPVP